MRRDEATRWVALLAAGTLFIGCGDDKEAVAPGGGDETPYGYTIEDAPPAIGPPIISIQGGRFTAIGQQPGLDGRAVIVRQRDGRSMLAVQIEGLMPGGTYPVHLHAWPCAANYGGGHYKLDPAIEDTVAENEIWPSVTANDTGIGVASLWVEHWIRGDGLSVVVHDPFGDNAKMACADLLPPPAEQWMAEGRFAPFAYATEADGTIGGTARLRVDGTGTHVELALTGLDPAATYASHVHAMPCGTTDGGGHYKLDPTIEETDEANELWPTLTIDEAGNGTGTLTNPNRVRGDAQSIVIHRKTPDAAPKVACAALYREDFGPLISEGNGVPFPVAIERGYGQLQATATLKRTREAQTQVVLGVQGLSPSQSYNAHVHAYSCATADGGGHYKLDPTVADVIQANELWLPFTTDNNGNGAAAITVPHLARAEARAVVIHDYREDGARVACVDLR